MYQPQIEIIHVGIIKANSGAFTIIELFLQYLSSDLMSNLWL